MVDRIRVFLDSSILIAAAISARGSARELLLRAFYGMVTLFVSPLVLEDSVLSLRRKAPEALPAFLIFRDTLAAERVDPPADLISQAEEMLALLEEA